jgi:hypothetical protein
VTGNGTNGSKPATVTKREARKVWEALGKPEDAAIVAASFWAIGRIIPVKTIDHWMKRWLELGELGQANPAGEPTPRTLEAAVETLDDLVPIVTHDPLARTRELILRLRETKTLDEISNLDESSLTRELSKRAQETMVMVLDEVFKQREYLVRERTAELGKLVKAIGETMEKAVFGYEKAVYLHERLAGVNAEILPPTRDKGPDPLAKSLQAWASA